MTDYKERLDILEDNSTAYEPCPTFVKSLLSIARELLAENELLKDALEAEGVVWTGIKLRVEND